MIDSANASRNGMGGGRWLEFAASDGGAVGVAIKGVAGDGAEEIFNQHLIGEEADDLAALVNDEEEEAVGAEKGGEGLGEGVVGAEIVEFRVNQIGGARSGLGVEVVESGGMDDADDFAGGVLDREMLKARAIETI